MMKKVLSNPRIIVSLIILVPLLVIALLGHLFTPYDPLEIDYSAEMCIRDRLYAGCARHYFCQSASRRSWDDSQADLSGRTPWRESRGRCRAHDTQSLFRR